MVYLTEQHAIDNLKMPAAIALVEHSFGQLVQA